MICKFVKGRQNDEHHRTLADINHDILLNYISNSIRILILYCIQNHENGKGGGDGYFFSVIQVKLNI